MVKAKTAKKKITKKAVKKNTKVTKKKVTEVSKEKKVVKKKEKKNPYLQKNFLIIVALFVIIVIAFIGISSVVSSSCGLSKFNFTIQGIDYCSNTTVPETFFGEFEQNETVYISPILDEVGADQLVVNAMNLWQVVLIGNEIDAIQLIRVKKEDQISYCFTNDGDVKTAERIELAECNNILNDSANAVVFLEEGREKVLMENKKIWIYSSTSKVVGQVNFAIIKQIFPNAQNILDIVNEKIYGIN
ncbi:MAG: hypothetical protein HON47_00730 [Candidatus Diapherotrites archaeon]|jgi:hypothetical protein|uniref:Uncharacterized protein n=1 Tax=Candidatus Iainarchaeum sp. TaxID=3101447 RepID=A0A8T5GD79_9ARCH|nr:hypothetical protein [Candidatus Diapherotrites archaeon]MBT7240965.1 hypothetical protein [Candidatus Diapherotrites archaeon]